VHIRERQHDRRRVELGSVLGEQLALAQHGEELTAETGLEQQVQLVARTV